jgi:hypothetical protein
MMPQKPRHVVPTCRLISLAVLALLLSPLVLAPPPASAHGGSGAAATREAGPYLVYVYDGEPGAEPNSIRYTLIVRDAETGRPVDGADVRITADSTVTAESASTSVGPITANGVANVYEYTLPDLGEARWKIQATIKAPLGTATTGTFTLHGPRPAAVSKSASDRSESSAAVPWGFWVAPAALVAAVVGLVIVRRRSNPPRTRP